MELPKYKNQHFDKIAFSKRFYDDPSSIDLILDIMVGFLKNEFKNEFKKSIVDKDLEKFNFILHKLKGSAATTCMLNLYKYCSELEKLNFEDEDKLANKVNELISEIDLILTMINESKELNNNQIITK